ncbi:sugar phosphate isomerase/epimerase family protein [Kineococcus rhizosphaerae]|uniref:Inosose dehydratase n=1 Tax=Kineococcus rhizosphaerae TaxID=559628 RepID=A0A2T0R271_9ACTN|nr:sugar phosphate isomerase/epimerase [Kineococcus rhizosphaerae]PRY13615.1 inosose dehydratase [Kineococcus rhizosphaerae]
MTDRAFGVDLITFFHHDFWGLADRAALTDPAALDPAKFWTGVFDGLEAAGVSEIEMTFAPADRRSALAAFGSAPAFKAELDRRGLRVVSSYFGDVEHATDVTDPAVRAAILESADAEAEFLAALGAKHLVTGLPMRRNHPSGHGLAPVDLATAVPIVDLLHEVGAVTARHGVTPALHTESHSVFWNARDVDLFLTLTDPLLVAFCPDTGHLLLSGADPVEVASRHRDRIVIAHWKDASGPFPQRGDLRIDDGIWAEHGPYFRAAGHGVMDWFAWARLLRDIDYTGGILLELDVAADPVGQLTGAREFLQNATRTTL